MDNLAATAMHVCFCGTTLLERDAKTAYETTTQWGSVRIQRCPTCRLAQSIHFPDAQKQKQLYETQEIYQTHPAGWFDEQVKSFGHVIQDLSKFLIPSGRLLEIGCNEGYALSTFRKAGFEAIGVEKNPACAERARQTHGLQVFRDLSELPQSWRFQIIFMSHVLEHIVEVALLMERLRERMAKGALLYLKVPNYGSVYARYLLRGKWPGFLPAQHAWYFEKSTLTNSLARYHFKEVRVYTRSFIPMGLPLSIKLPGKILLGGLERIFDCGQEIVGIYRSA